MYSETQINQRQFTRVSFIAAADIKQGAHTWPTEILDISMKGMLVSLPPDIQLSVKQPIYVRVHLGEDQQEIRFKVSIVHVGCAQVGFEINQLDLESMTHLRRLIELNLPEDSVVGKELDAFSEISPVKH